VHLPERHPSQQNVSVETNDIPPEEVETTKMDSYCILQGSYVDAASDQAVEDYGSMEAHICDGLGISDEEGDRLRSQLLN